MKFSPQNNLKYIRRCRFLTKSLFLHSFLVLFLVLSLIFNIFINPSIAHASLFSSIMSGISGGISELSPNQAIANGIPPTDPLQNTPSENNEGYNLLVAAVNSDLTPVPDCSVPVTGNTISSEFDPCSVATTTNTQISTYVVRSGDTLSGIASLFNVSVNTIVWVNDLDRTAPLQAGVTLVILPVSGIQYTIKKGDTIGSIANHYGVGQDEILQYNNITLSSALSPGDTIIIPDAALDGPQSNSSSVLTGSPAKTSGNKGTVSSKSKWGSTGSNPAHNTNGPSYPGYYDLPLAHGSETQGLHGYNAVDLAAPKGMSVIASAAGTVIISIKNGGWNGGYGNYVVINHSNGTQTLYAHLSKVTVSPGETVVQSEKIGLVGATGEATGPHVHFEIRGAHNPFADVGVW